MLDHSDSGYYTLADAAALLGKKTDTLKKWFGNGCPHRKNGRSYEVSIADVFDWRIEYEKEILLGGDDGPAEYLNLEQERARLAKEQRLEKEMTNAKLRGELVSAVDVDRGWGELVANCTSKLNGIGNKIAARLAVPNQRQVAIDINAGISSALRELSCADIGTSQEDAEEV